MIKQSGTGPNEPPSELAKPVAPEQAPAIDRARELQARFDTFSNSELARSLKRLHFDSPLSQAVKEMTERQRRLSSVFNPQWSQSLKERQRRLSSVFNPQWSQSLKEMQRRFSSMVNPPYLQAVKEMQGRLSSVLNSPVYQTLKETQEWQRRLGLAVNSPIAHSLKRMQAQFESPAFAAIKAARLWSDSFSEARAAQASMQESLQVFQRAAQEAAAMARVDVRELAAAVDASLGSLPPSDGAELSASPATSRPAPRSLEDIWKGLPFSVLVFVFFLWHLFLEPLAQAYVDQWVKATPESERQINVTQNFGEDFSRHVLRCVRGAGVKIRESPSKAARVIGRLGHSQAVAILETKSGFSKIRYEDPASREIREGWVASGYLLRVAC